MKKIIQFFCPHIRKGYFYGSHCPGKPNADGWLPDRLPEGWYAFCVHCDKRLNYLGGDSSHEGQLSAIRRIGGNV